MKDQDLMFLLLDPLQPSHTCTQTPDPNTQITFAFFKSNAEYPATWVNLFLHMTRSLKICAQVESGTHEWQGILQLLQ